MKTPRLALTPEEERHFLEKGHVVLRACFKPESAAPVIAAAYARLGYDPGDPKTWKEWKRSLPATQGFPLSEFAPRALAVTCDLAGGAERLRGGTATQSWSDSFQIKFPRGGAPIPMAEMDWHLDGDETHYLDNPLGPAAYALWSDLEPNGGGTFIAPDSIGHVARYLAGHPEGVPRNALPSRKLFESCKEFVELTGKAGDVVMVHPLMLHSESANIAGAPRFFTVRIVDLQDRLNLEREEKREFSPVEAAILRGLGVERLAFRRR